MKISLVSEKQWLDFIAEGTFEHVYQDVRWLDLIGQVYPSLKIRRLAATDRKGRMKWLLPLVQVRPLGKRTPMAISCQFANYGGFIYPKENIIGPAGREDAERIKAFMEDLPENIIEIRELEKPAYDAIVSDQYQRFEIALPESDHELWKKTLSGNARTSVRKAQKTGVKVSVNREDAVSVLVAMNEKNAAFHGTPVHSRQWFARMARLFSNEAFIFTATFINKDVGAALVLNDGKRAILHTLSADPAYRDLYASDLLVWESIKHAATRTHAVLYDFGRTRPDPGQLFFKRKWGGVAKHIYYTYFTKPGAEIPRFDPHSRFFKAAGHIWRRLPGPVTRLISPYLRMRISA